MLAPLVIDVVLKMAIHVLLALNLLGHMQIMWATKLLRVIYVDNDG